jgi:hypothetical protein
MSNRWIGVVLAWGVACAAAGAEPADSQMQVWAKSDQAGSKNVVHVVARAPLPEGTVVVIGLYYGTEQREEARVASPRHVEMRNGEAKEDLAGDPSEFFPGDYRVTVRVDENQPGDLKRRLAPPLRRLEGQTSVVIGSRAQVCDAVNKMIARLLSQSRAAMRIYPALNGLLDRAWNKNLQDSEWRAWGPRAELEKARDQMNSLIFNRTLGRLVPRSVAQSQVLTVDLFNMCRSIDDLLKGRIRDNDNLIKPKPGMVANNPPAFLELHGTLYAEGRGVYATAADQILADVQAAYDQRRGKGAGNWESLLAGWTKTIQEIDGFSEEFEKLEWLVDRLDKAVRLKEALVGVKEYAAQCGRVLKGDATEETAELSKRRETLRQQIGGLNK